MSVPKGDLPLELPKDFDITSFIKADSDIQTAIAESLGFCLSEILSLINTRHQKYTAAKASRRALNDRYIPSLISLAESSLAWPVPSSSGPHPLSLDHPSSSSSSLNPPPPPFAVSRALCFSNPKIQQNAQNSHVLPGTINIGTSSISSKSSNSSSSSSILSQKPSTLLHLNLKTGVFSDPNERAKIKNPGDRKINSEVQMSDDDSSDEHSSVKNYIEDLKDYYFDNCSLQDCQREIEKIMDAKNHRYKGPYVNNLVTASGEFANFEECPYFILDPSEDAIQLVPEANSKHLFSLFIPYYIWDLAPINTNPLNRAIHWEVVELIVEVTSEGFFVFRKNDPRPLTGKYYDLIESLIDQEVNEEILEVFRTDKRDAVTIDTLIHTKTPLVDYIRTMDNKNEEDLKALMEDEAPGDKEKSQKSESSMGRKEKEDKYKGERRQQKGEFSGHSQTLMNLGTLSLELAAKNGNLAAFQLLYDSHRSDLKRSMDQNDKIVFQQRINRALFSAIFYGWIDIIQFLVKNHSEIIYQRSERNDVALIALIKAPIVFTIKRNILLFLLNSDATPGHALLNATWKNGFNPLMAALELPNKDSEELLEVLLANQPDLLYRRMNDGRTLLHQAAHAGNLFAVQMLLKRDERSFLVCAKDNRGETAVFSAVKCNHLEGQQCEHLEVVKCLVQNRKLELSEIFNSNKYNILHKCANFGNVSIAQYLMESDDVPQLIRQSLITSFSESGELAIHFATMAGKVQIVRYFVTLFEKDILRSETRDGYTPFMLLLIEVEKRSEGHLELLRYFLSEDPLLLVQHNKDRRLQIGCYKSHNNVKNKVMNIILKGIALLTKQALDNSFNATIDNYKENIRNVEALINYFANLSGRYEEINVYKKQKIDQLERALGHNEYFDMEDAFQSMAGKEDKNGVSPLSTIVSADKKKNQDNEVVAMDCSDKNPDIASDSKEQQDKASNNHSSLTTLQSIVTTMDCSDEHTVPDFDSDSKRDKDTPLTREVSLTPLQSLSFSDSREILHALPEGYEVTMLSDLLKDKPELLFTTDNNGESFLRKTLASLRLDTLKLLKANHSFIFLMRDQVQRTPLMALNFSLPENAEKSDTKIFKSAMKLILQLDPLQVFHADGQNRTIADAVYFEGSNPAKNPLDRQFFALMFDTLSRIFKNCDRPQVRELRSLEELLNLRRKECAAAYHLFQEKFSEYQILEGFLNQKIKSLTKNISQLTTFFEREGYKSRQKGARVSLNGAEVTQGAPQPCLFSEDSVNANSGSSTGLGSGIVHLGQRLNTDGNSNDALSTESGIDNNIVDNNQDNDIGNRNENGNGNKKRKISPSKAEAAFNPISSPMSVTGLALESAAKKSKIK